MLRCIIIDDEPLAQDLLVSQLKKIPNIEPIAVFENAFDAMIFIKTNEIDLVFCDIQMPDMNGISLLKSLAKPPLFVFVTGDPNYALIGYELNVLDYILKPFNIERLVKTINKAQVILNFDSSSHKDYIVIKDRSHLIITPYNELFSIKADKDYVWIETLEKNYNIYKKLIEMESELVNAKQFVRVHKSYIVNLDFAKRVEGNIIIMKGSIDPIPIGKQYKSKLYKRLGVSVV